MSKTKIPLTREIAKYIFPGTDPDIAEGEDGDILYNFKRLYPERLGIFIPSEVERSNFNTVFPRDFESYFVNVYDEVAFMSRMLEIPIKPNLPDIGIECVPGNAIKHSGSVFTVFRFDSLLRQDQRTYLLCRAPLNRIRIDDRIAILNTNPIMSQEAQDIAGANYYYWIMKIDSLFFSSTEIIAAMFAFSHLLREN